MKIKDAVRNITETLYDFRLEKTVDKLVAGNPEEELSGIATTFLATCEVIQNAASADCNLIISHEPVFYGHLDQIESSTTNRVIKNKISLIRESGVTIWRLHDHKHRKAMDPVFHALANRLGWNEYRNESNFRIFRIPDINLRDLISRIKSKLGLAYIRYIGDEKQICRKAGILVGAPGGLRQIRFMDENDLDVLICGEINEWEISEYIKDANFQGLNKSLVIIGHEESERDAMVLLAERLKDIFPNCPVIYHSSSEKFAIKVI